MIDEVETTTVTFVLEQHLGHRTYAENLRTGLSDERGLDAQWVPVTYDVDNAGRIASLLPTRVTSMLAGRREVRQGLRRPATGVRVFNTQVPAAIGGRRARSLPYVVVTDVTPIQYDRLSSEYGHRGDRPGPIGLLKHQINRRVFAQAEWCVGWSSWAAESISADYGVDKERVVVIPPGVDTNRWQPNPHESRDGFRVLFVGGEFERKGGTSLLEAFKSLSPRAELYLVTKSAVPRSERVHVIDDLLPNDPRLVELFKSCNVFALPSLAETFGIAAVEASAAGLPIVASAVGGLTDIVVPGRTGFTVPAGDTEQLAATLRRLEDEPDLCRRLGSEARKRAVELFDATTNAHRLFDLACSKGPSVAR